MRIALLILEFALVFGGTVAFCLWQIRSVRREMAKDAEDEATATDRQARASARQPAGSTRA